jgi:hypothetical protein
VREGTEDGQARDSMQKLAASGQHLASSNRWQYHQLCPAPASAPASPLGVRLPLGHLIRRQHDVLLRYRRRGAQHAVPSGPANATVRHLAGMHPTRAVLVGLRSASLPSRCA